MGVTTRSKNARVTKAVPVTIISGFLGSGKTTLLEHILTSPSHGLQIAVIVNDMASLNIDASLIRRHVVSQTQEKLIQLENGCICCTLRGDLLEELAKLSQSGACDYIVIESTGISEPMQVAETFTEDFTHAMLQAAADGGEALKPEDEKILNEIANLGGLNKIAKLDTLVTVVDAFNFFQNFSTTEFITDRWGKEDIDPEDERTVTDLMVDQIEFANVIIINKVDTVDNHIKKRVHKIIKQLNPKAKVIESKFSAVDIREVLSTGVFDFVQAATGMGWLQSLHELSQRDVNGQLKIAPKPETEEYGISSFVYRARKPFHPKRLYKLIREKFILMEGQMDEEDGEDGSVREDDDEELDDISDENSSNDGTAKDSDSQTESDDEDLDKPIDPKAVLANKTADPAFRGLLRSKGFFWLATRPANHGEWSQAGAMLTLQGGAEWFCTQSQENWPEDADIKQSIEEDFEGEWGDRRQEIVMIGESLDRSGLETAFNDCLLSDSEMKEWETVMRSSDDMKAAKLELEERFEDGFEDWPEMEDEHHDHDHGHHH